MPKKHKPAKDPVQVEAKTIATGASSSILGVLVAIAYAVEGDPSTIGFLPVWAQTLILAALVALVPTGASYAARHTHRTDVPTPLQVAGDQSGTVNRKSTVAAAAELDTTVTTPAVDVGSH